MTLVGDKLTAITHATFGKHEIAPVMIHTPIDKFVIVNLFTTVEDKPTPVLLVTANCEPSCPVVGRDKLDKLTDHYLKIANHYN